MPTQIAFQAIGTDWEIDIDQSIGSDQLKNLKQTIQDRIEQFDKTYSRFRTDSTLMQLANQPGRYKLPDDARPLFEFYKSLYKATGGKVTPLIGNTLADAGYDASYSLQPKDQLSPAPKWEDALQYQHPYITTKQPVILDVGAAGKGYLVDIIGEIIDNAGVQDYLINASGDMLHRSQTAETISIGLEHPADPSSVIGVVKLGNESICGSAGNRRQWAGLHHIMDPDAAQPVQDITAVWAVAATAMLADGLATALFFTPAAKLMQTYKFQYLLVRSDMSCQYSPDLQAEVY